MNLLGLNAAIAVGWAAISGNFSAGNLLLGFVMGFAALFLTRRLYGETRYFHRVWWGFGLAGYFIYDLFMSSFRVLWDVFTPPIMARPGVIAVPLRAESDVEIFLTANLVSLTPGTLSLDLSDDKRLLYVHAMFAEDAAAIRRSLQEGMERRVLEALR